MRALRISFLALFVCLIAVPLGQAIGGIERDKYYFLSSEKIVEYVHEKEGRKAVFIYTSWCPYCRKKLPAMVQIEGMRKGSVIPISVDEDPNALLRYVMKIKNFPFHTFVLNEKRGGELERRFGANPRTGVPYIILLDEDNKLYKAGNFNADYVANYVLGE